MSDLTKSTHTGYRMPVLIYPTGSLAPVISQATVELHYGKHLQTYVDNLNRLVAGTDFEGMTLREIISQAPPPTPSSPNTGNSFSQVTGTRIGIRPTAPWS